MDDYENLLTENEIHDIMLELQEELINLYLENEKLQKDLQLKNKTIRELESSLLNEIYKNDNVSKASSSLQPFSLEKSQSNESQLTSYISRNKERVFANIRKILHHKTS